MHELIDKVPLVDKIRHIIRSKDWYALTESSRFIWTESVQLMARMINEEITGVVVTPEEIHQVIEESFTVSALTKANDEIFINELLKIDPKLILWSEGDIPWQSTKFSQVGLGKKIKNLNLFAKNKTDGLVNIISSLVSESDGELVIVVIDDKDSKLKIARDLQDVFLEQGVEIRTFLLSLGSEEKNTIDCLEFIQSLSDKAIRIVSDMDGVIIDTDRVLQDTAAERLARLIEDKR